MVKVGKYTSPMDGMGNKLTDFFDFWTETVSGIYENNPPENRKLSISPCNS